MTTNNAVEPLQNLLGSLINRLEALESAAGVSPPPAATSATATTATVTEGSPAIKAYDDHLTKDVEPLVKACADLGKLEVVGTHLQAAWTGVRFAVVLASKAKAPKDIPTALMPHLKSVQTALEAIRKLRLDRKFDAHIKSVLELVTCLSWVLIKPPPQTPAAFIKEAIASCTFWSNKIRKEYKGKDDKQILFCDCLKTVGAGLVEYVTKYHLTGLTFNPKGGSIEEVAAAAAGEAKESDAAPAVKPAKKSSGGGGVGSLISELQTKQTSDGSSAATGLRKVTRDQQTWRKEYQGEKASTVSVTSKTAAAKTSTVKPKKVLPPVCEYRERGNKWVVEHQTKKEGPSLSIDIADPKQQVYVYNCEDVTIQVKGDKLKSLILDKCRRVNVVFNSCISSCEVVNSQKIQCQTTGLCPTFSIDKTVGCVVYLSEQSVKTTSFVTSQSSEMNVSYPDDKGVMKEVPIPEQFIHKIGAGAAAGLTSEVSDLYH